MSKPEPMEREPFGDEALTTLWNNAVTCGHHTNSPCPSVLRALRAAAKRAFEMAADMLEAPGRHVTEWDGGWDDAVAEALRQSILALAAGLDKERTDA